MVTGITFKPREFRPSGAAIVSKLHGSFHSDDAADQHSAGSVEIEWLAAGLFVRVPPVAGHLVGEGFHVESRKHRVPRRVHFMGDDATAFTATDMARGTHRGTLDG